MTWHIEQGDCLETLRTMPDNYVHAVVTDPPAGIAFMGKEWDRMKREGMTELQAFQEFICEVFTEIYRVLKPGGHAVVWALPRTSHHTAMGLERAGFDIRDNGTYLFHVFGSGFPKSHNVALSIDKAAGHANRGRAIPTASSYQACDTERENKLTSNPVEDYAAKTKAAKPWEGWGTALKPAVEFWILARKPLEGTVAENVLTHGTGALNIDGTRIPHANAEDFAKHKAMVDAIKARGGSMENSWKNSSDLANANDVQTAGRWPAHLILDEGAAAMLDAQSGPKSASFVRNRTEGARPFNNDGKPTNYTSEKIEAVDDGSTRGASRFFYIAKANKRDKDEGLDHLAIATPGEKTDRDEGSAGITPYAGSRGPSKNTHPTVKSTELMRWLVRLVAPPGGIVLDPFMGSGSTGKAAIIEGFDFIGLEKEPDYCKIAEARLAHAEENR